MSGNTVRGLLEDAVRRLTSAGVESARRNAEWMLSEVLSEGRAAMYAGASASVSAERRERFEEMLQRRLRREPLQYILGFAEFCGLRLGVTPEVLIPRPETEELVASVLHCLEGHAAPRVLDVGTGSGCIALALKKALPNAHVYACDVSVPALEVARQNAALHDLRVELFEADALAKDFVERAPDGLDLLVSNPPYVPEDEEPSLAAEVYGYEPHMALFARVDPVVFYRALARHGRKLLQPAGWIALETHAEYGRTVVRILEEAGFRAPELSRDLAGKDRIVVAAR
jgi:release factor glutamine methyltransferase